MGGRPQSLKDFLDALRSELGQRQWGAAAGRCLWRVFDALDKPQSVVAKDSSRLPACAHLGAALATAREASPALARIADAFAVLEPHLAWMRRASFDHTASANFADGHANAMIVGPGGLEDRRDVWLGASLLAPDVRYPDHDHAPEETYLVLTEGEFMHGNSGWFTPGVGGSFHNTPGIPHPMRSGGKPLFAFWALLPQEA